MLYQHRARKWGQLYHDLPDEEVEPGEKFGYFELEIALVSSNIPDGTKTDVKEIVESGSSRRKYRVVISNDSDIIHGLRKVEQVMMQMSYPPAVSKPELLYLQN